MGFLELMKTHVNKLTINQLVKLIKGLSNAAESAVAGGDVDKSSSSSSSSSSQTAALSKLMATLMGTEKLMLMRFVEEQSWLSCAEIVDLVTYVRESELTKEIYNH